MDKYGTFEIFKNKETGEIKEIPLHYTKELNKVASDKEWSRVSKPKSEEK